ncbi:MAG TPA: hypothetical protein VG413_08925 [Candidatus Dormibacteraeota bacterium]|nr:hypothetical protein [Candidatus Dormibacteraeota bacterium]
MDSSVARASSRAIGALWITLFGAWSSSVVLGAWPTPLAITAWALVIFALGSAGVVQLSRIRKLSTGKGQWPVMNRDLVRKVGVVLIGYAISAVLAASVLHWLRHDTLILPVLVVIVGLHFGAFARVLHVWQYYLTGVLACVGVAITLLATEPGSSVGALSSWILFPLLGNGVALFATAGLMIAESEVLLTRRGRPS